MSTETNQRVCCGNCKYWARPPRGLSIYGCRHPDVWEEKFNPMSGLYRQAKIKWSEKNKNGDCDWYEYEPKHALHTRHKGYGRTVP